MEHDEIEIKYRLTDPDAPRRRLLDLGLVSTGRVFERNIRFEDAANSLIDRKALLRLRQDRHNTLTYKQAAPAGDNRFKIYREIETRVDDFEATRRILESLGFSPCQIYEKYRETFTTDGAVICLDTMPYGDFLEIEGDKRQILELSDRLGMNWHKRILATYLEMFADLRQAVPLSFNDLTFANFAAVRDDFTDFWEKYEQGPAG